MNKLKKKFKTSAGTQHADFSDCRQYGCTAGECIREGSQYVCKQGMFIYSFLFFAFNSISSNHKYKM